MREATLRDFLYGTVPAEKLAAEVREAVEPLSGNRRRVHIEDLPANEEVTITAEMLVRVCDAFLAGTLPGSALEIVAFAVLASDHMHWSEEDDLVGRILYDWAMLEINWELTSSNVRMFQDWLTGRAHPSSEPDVTTDTLSGLGYLRRISKVQLSPRLDADAPDEA